ncbi:hypothetical protein PC122_g11140, partial [Phytophthora cactorum]
MIAEAALRSAERFLDGSAGNETTAISSGSGDLESLETGAQRMRVTLVFILSGFVTIWLLCVGLIWHMRVNRAGAFKGDAAAARKVILPAYEPVLFVLAAINGVYIVFLVVTLATDYYDVRQASSRIVVGSIVLHYLPPSRATKRIIRELCFVTIVYFLLTVLLMILIMDPKTADKSRYVVYVMLSWVAFCPLVVWRVLKADTEYWRGVGQRACALQDYFQRENGLSERVSSKGLHVLIEMNRKFVIDFAYLGLIRQLGVGSKSTVFQGTLKMKTHVAVKAYTPTSCSDNVVAAFSHEAAMCSVLNHPNIVKFHG